VSATRAGSVISTTPSPYRKRQLIDSCTGPAIDATQLLVDCPSGHGVVAGPLSSPDPKQNPDREASLDTPPATRRVAGSSLLSGLDKYGRNVLPHLRGIGNPRRPVLDHLARLLSASAVHPPGSANPSAAIGSS